MFVMDCNLPTMCVCINISRPFKKALQLQQYLYELSFSGPRGVARADCAEAFSADRSSPAGGSAELRKDCFSPVSWQ